MVLKLYVCVCVCRHQVDYVAASESLNVSLNAFSGNDYRLAWLLLLPAVNYAK